MIRRVLFMCILCMSLFVPGGAQSVKEEPAEVRHPPQEKIADYASQRAFQYNSVPQNPETLIDRFKRWLGIKLDKLMSNPTAKSVFRIFIYIGFGLLIVLIINQMMKGNVSGLFTGTNIDNPHTFTVDHEPSNQEELESLIKKAIKDREYRLATRYLYQDSLRRLRNSGHIDWKKEKTNSDYVYEIERNDLQTIFRELTRYYEYAEYGNFALSGERFAKVHNRFKEMRTLIQNR